MTIRKRRNPTPEFKLPPPFNSMEGQFAPLGEALYATRLALFQVYEEDTHDDYLVCRGFDPSCGAFYDGTNGKVSVAKPYDCRGLHDYEIAELIVCAKIVSRLGDNAGQATSTGQPADLDEEISLLEDDDSKPITWMHIGSKRAAVYAVQMQTELTSGNGPQKGDLFTDKDGTDLNKQVDVYGALLGDETLKATCWGYVMLNSKGKWLLIAAECGCTGA